MLLFVCACEGQNKVFLSGRLPPLSHSPKSHTPKEKRRLHMIKKCSRGKKTFLGGPGVFV